jgi:hypothetical protein
MLILCFQSASNSPLRDENSLHCILLAAHFTPSELFYNSACFYIILKTCVLGRGMQHEAVTCSESLPGPVLPCQALPAGGDRWPGSDRR